MQIIKHGLLFCLCLSIPLVAANCSQNKDSKKARLVEVWTGAAHDGLTQKLNDSLDNGFKSSKDFTYSYGKKHQTLIVYIPTHVMRKQVGKHTEIFYKIEFTSIDNKILNTIEGSCPEDKIEDCTKNIIREATIVSKKM